MRLLLFMTFLLTGLFAAPHVWAFQQLQYSTETFNQTFVYSDIPAFSPAPKGGLGWDVFTTTTENYVYGTGRRAHDILAVHPRFSKALEAYDGQEVLMSGYMFPLEDSDSQKHFLFGPFPMTCPFHYHVPPILVIETHTKEPIRFTYDPVLLRGKLQLVRDLDREPYYRMSNARLETSQSIVQDDAAKPAVKSFNPLFHASPMEIRKRGGVIPDVPSAGDYKVQ